MENKLVWFAFGFTICWLLERANDLMVHLKKFYERKLEESVNGK